MDQHKKMLVGFSIWVGTLWLLTILVALDFSPAIEVVGVALIILGMVLAVGLLSMNGQEGNTWEKS